VERSKERFEARGGTTRWEQGGSKKEHLGRRKDGFNLGFQARFEVGGGRWLKVV